MFESDTLDDRNWVMDFGGLKAFKDWAEYMFDHTLVVAQDDPIETCLKKWPAWVYKTKVVSAMFALLKV